MKKILLFPVLLLTLCIAVAGCFDSKRNKLDNYYKEQFEFALLAMSGKEPWMVEAHIDWNWGVDYMAKTCDDMLKDGYTRAEISEISDVATQAHRKAFENKNR